MMDFIGTFGNGDSADKSGDLKVQGVVGHFGPKLSDLQTDPIR